MMAAVDVRRTTFAPIPPPVCPSDVTTMMPNARAAIEVHRHVALEEARGQGRGSVLAVGASCEAGSDARHRKTRRTRSPSRIGVRILPRLSMILPGFQHR